MEKMTVHSERCKGCGYCMEFCPKKALSQSSEINEKGYLFAVCDESACVKCGICHTVCPDNVFEII